MASIMKFPPAKGPTTADTRKEAAASG
jgi:hypothetical protein